VRFLDTSDDRLGRALRLLSRTGLRRGLSGSRPWVVVGVAATGARLLRNLAREQPEVLYRTVLRPGERFEIVTSSRR
jgi:hypothetical protein